MIYAHSLYAASAPVHLWAVQHAAAKRNHHLNILPCEAQPAAAAMRGLFSHQQVMRYSSAGARILCAGAGLLHEVCTPG